MRRRQKSRDVGGGAFLLPPPPPSPFATVSDGEERKKRPPPPPPQTRKVDWSHPAWLVGWLTTAGKGGPLGKPHFNGLNIQGEMGKLPSKLQSKFLKVSRKKRREKKSTRMSKGGESSFFCFLLVSAPPTSHQLCPEAVIRRKRRPLLLLLQFSTNPPFPFPPRYFSAAPSEQLGSQRTQYGIRLLFLLKHKDSLARVYAIQPASSNDTLFKPFGKSLPSSRSLLSFPSPCLPRELFLSSLFFHFQSLPPPSPLFFQGPSFPPPPPLFCIPLPYSPGSFAASASFSFSSRERNKKIYSGTCIRGSNANKKLSVCMGKLISRQTEHASPPKKVTMSTENWGSGTAQSFPITLAFYSIH